MRKTMCRWCGGEMELISFRDMDDNGVLFYQWKCDGCRCKSYLYGQESEALAWAEQPIPFLPEKRYTQDDYISELVWELGADKGHNELIEQITTALAVREEE